MGHIDPRKKRLMGTQGLGDYPWSIDGRDGQLTMTICESVQRTEEMQCFTQVTLRVHIKARGAQPKEICFGKYLKTRRAL
jgi:hypothetical protein